jgi:hypothetical protein
VLYRVVACDVLTEYFYVKGRHLHGLGHLTHARRSRPREHRSWNASTVCHIGTRAVLEIVRRTSADREGLIVPQQKSWSTHSRAFSEDQTLSAKHSWNANPTARLLGLLFRLLEARAQAEGYLSVQGRGCSYGIRMHASGGNCQHARAVAVLTAPHEGRAAAHLCGALNSLQRYNRAARAGRDRCIPHCVRNSNPHSPKSQAVHHPAYSTLMRQDPPNTLVSYSGLIHLASVLLFRPVSIAVLALGIVIFALV